MWFCVSDVLCYLCVFILHVLISVIRHKGAASWYARATFWGWVFWFGYWERNYGKLNDFPFIYDVIDFGFDILK